MAGYDFVSPGAMAGDALLDFLVQRDLEKRQRMLDELRQRSEAEAIRQRDEQMALQRRQFDADEGERTRRATREAEQDRIAAEDRSLARSKEQNRLGVLQMSAAAANQGTAPGIIARQAMGEGVEIPMDVLDPGADARAQAERDKRLHGYQMEEIAAQGDQSRGTAAARATNGAQGTPSYADRSRSRLMTAIDNLAPLINERTVGTMRAKALRTEPFLSGSQDPTVDFDAALGQIKALIGFNELNEMRRASPTGGALGQVTERELAFLQSVMGALDPNQSEPAFRAQLQKVRDEIQRVVDYGLEGSRSAGGAGGNTIRMRAPDGRILQVPADQVEEARRRGAALEQ